MVSYPDAKAMCEKISKTLVNDKGNKTDILPALWGKKNQKLKRSTHILHDTVI